MTTDELAAELDVLPPGQLTAVAALARRVRGEALALPDAAVRLAEGTHAVQAGNARDLVGELEDLTIRTMLDAPLPPAVQHHVWRLGTAVAAIVSLRARAAERLRGSLGDRRLVPIEPYPAHVEEQPYPRRVCDEAYLMLRELLHTGESRSQFALDARAYLRLGDDEKDAEIARLAAGQPFARLVDDLEA
jgi:hypothetical protein